MRAFATFSDADLIELLPSRKEAFDVLFLRHQNDLRNVVIYYVRDKHQAEDLVQEAFLKIYLSLKAGRYCDESKFLPWALRIARNLCMDHLRKAKPKFDSRVDRQPVSTSWPDGENAEMILVREEQRRELNALTKKLSLEQQKIIAHRYHEDLRFKEIAILMNTSVNTSLGRMRYALDHLRKHIIGNPLFA